ncbi:hypothetical protein QJQ45_003641 [Haematococcus lacustris]|nr:hypothetical protein QJQ45_003641 [Haematococcus lacustris]
MWCPQLHQATPGDLGKWVDRDSALNMQRAGESKWRPLELCRWEHRARLPAQGKEYPALGFKKLRDRAPKAQAQQPPRGGGRQAARSRDDGASGKRLPARRNTVAVQQVAPLDSGSDEDDQHDAFQQKRDKVSLEVSSGGDSDSDELDVEGVMDLDDDEEDEEDEELDSEDLLEEAMQRGGRMGQLARQAKQLSAKQKLLQGEDDEDDEKAAVEAAGRKGSRPAKATPGVDDSDKLSWGANKRAYYAADELDPEDEEGRQLEEEEVVTLQRDQAARTTAADYGLSDDDDDDDEDEDDEEEEEEEEEEGMEEEEDRAGTMGAAARKVAKELHALTADERSAALLADAPELLALIEDLQASLHEVRHRVGPLLQEVRSGRLATAEGLSYLEAKHLLMLHYCCHIVFYLMLKAEGRPVRDHPVIMRLVEIRSYLEKIRPIDKQLAYQVDKLLRAASLAATAELQQGGGSAAAGEQEEDEADVMRYGPRPDTLVPKGGSAGAAAAAGQLAAGSKAVTAGGVTDKGSGLYRPPRLNPVSMEGEMGGGRQSREDQRRMAEAKRRAARSDAVAELAAEVAGAPEELRTALPGFDSMAAIKTRQKLEARQQEEEDIMTRVPLSRDQVKALKAQRRAGMTASSLVGDFADEVADLVAATSAADAGAGATRGNTLADVFARQKVSQRFGAEPVRQVTLGGDEDLPRRANLSERRAKFDAVAARKAVMPPQQDDDDNGFEDYDVVPGGRGSSKRGTREQGEEDDFYQAAKEAAASRKKARAEAHRAPQLPPPLPDPSAGAGARGITKAIEKNRGLTPHRRKDLKNPRKKHRIMFAKALVRRSGAVQDGSKTRDAGAAAYAGEATGIKSKEKAYRNPNLSLVVVRVLVLGNTDRDPFYLTAAIYKLTSTSADMHTLLRAALPKKAIFVSSNATHASLLAKAKASYKSPAAPTVSSNRAGDMRHNSYSTLEYEEAIAAVVRADAGDAVLAPYLFLYDTKAVVLKDLTAAFKEETLEKVDKVLSSMGCEDYTIHAETYKLGGTETFELQIEATHEEEEIRRAGMLGLIGATISSGGLLSTLQCTQPLTASSSTTTLARPLIYFPKAPSPSIALTLKMTSNGFLSDPAANAVLTNRGTGAKAISLIRALGYLRHKMAQDVSLRSHPVYLLACSVHSAHDVTNRSMTKVEFTDSETCAAIQSSGDLQISGSKVKFALTQPQTSRVSGLDTKHSLVLSTAAGIGLAGLASVLKAVAEAELTILEADLILNATYQAGSTATPPLKGTAATASNVSSYSATTKHVSLASSNSSSIIAAVGQSSRAQTTIYPGGGPERAAIVYTVAAMSSKGRPIQDSSRRAITVTGHDDSYTGSGAAVGTDSAQPLHRKENMLRATCYVMAEAHHLTHTDQRKANFFLDCSRHLMNEDWQQGHEGSRRGVVITSSLDRLVTQCLPLVKAMLEVAASRTDSARAVATRKVQDIYTVMVDICSPRLTDPAIEQQQHPTPMAAMPRPPMGVPRSSTQLPGRAQSVTSLPPRGAGSSNRRTSDERQSPTKHPLKRHNSTSPFQHLADEMEGVQSLDRPSA